jgi:hypothetical protein
MSAVAMGPRIGCVAAAEGEAGAEPGGGAA